MSQNEIVLDNNVLIHEGDHLAQLDVLGEGDAWNNNNNNNNNNNDYTNNYYHNNNNNNNINMIK